MPGKPESGASVQIFGGRETETVKQEGASGVCGGGRVCVDVCVWLGHVCMWTYGGGGWTCVSGGSRPQCDSCQDLRISEEALGRQLES